MILISEGINNNEMIVYMQMHKKCTIKYLIKLFTLNNFTDDFKYKK